MPAFLHPLTESKEPARLSFAKWLASRKSPTTARALVNRVWQTYFGTGLVSTSEDFGIQSDAPSHPELLDWLAARFVREGWSFKTLHRLIISRQPIVVRTGGAECRRDNEIGPEG